MANYYRRPLIYMPKKKITINRGQGSAEVGVPVEYDKIKYSDFDNMLVSFWLTPHTDRTPSSPDLVLSGKTIYYNSAYTTSGARMHMLKLGVDETDANVVKNVWNLAGYNSLFINVYFDNIYLFTAGSNGTHLYKINTSNIDNYGVVLYGNSYTVSNLPGGSSSTVRCVNLNNPTPYANLRDNATIQNKLSDAYSSSSAFVYISQPLSDSEILNLCEVYAMPANQVEQLTI